MIKITMVKLVGIQGAKEEEILLKVVFVNAKQIMVVKTVNFV